MQTPATSYPVLPLWGLALLCMALCWWLNRAAPSAPPVAARTEPPHVARVFTAPSARYRPASCEQRPTEGAATPCHPAWSILVGRQGDVHPGHSAAPDRDRPRSRGL